MKIALVGSAPSSVDLAPFDDPEWMIWACSPSSTAKVKRCDAFFELHRYDPRDVQTWYPEYVAWMKALECPLYLIEAHADFPTSVAYPAEAMLARFGRNFFTSSLAWMMALAIVAIEDWRNDLVCMGEDGHLYTLDGKLYTDDLRPEAEIGLWGVDMAADTEYDFQKPGCLYFAEKAAELGIKVKVPPESDLLNPPPLYGIGEASHSRIKMTARKVELAAKMAAAAQRAEQLNQQFQIAAREAEYFRGASENEQYHLQTWTE